MVQIIRAALVLLLLAACGNGDDGTPPPSEASAVIGAAGLDRVIAVAVGSRGGYSAHGGQSCAVQDGGALWCWGRDVNGVDQLVPKPVPTAQDAVAVTVGSGHACFPAGAWTTPGTPRSTRSRWPTSPVPRRCRSARRTLAPSSPAARCAAGTSAVAVTGLTRVTSLAAGVSDFRGFGHTCAQRSSGDVVCWGTATLGNGSSRLTEPGAPGAVLGQQPLPPARRR